MDRSTSEHAVSPGWMLDELTTAGRENLDTDHAWSYDHKEDADVAPELELLQRFGLGRDSVLVDLGAGTGQLASAAAGVCARVVAVDVSPVMLAPLEAKLAASRATNVEVVRAGFLTYEHQGRPADVVYSRFALHHLSDFWKALALARAHRFMTRGGLLRLWDVVYDFPAHEIEDRIEAWCAAYDGAADGEWTRADVEEHVRDEYSTFSWVMEAMIGRCGFDLVEARYSEDGLFARYVARAL